MPVGPFAPESKTGVPKIAERGAPGRHPSLTKAPTARRSAPPVYICRTPRAKAAGSRDCESSSQPDHPLAAPPAATPSPRPLHRHPGQSAAQSRDLDSEVVGLDPGAVDVCLDLGSSAG